MRLITFQRGSALPEPGVVVGSNAVSLTAAGFPDLLSVIAAGDAALAKIEAHAAKAPAAGVTPLADVKLLAPLPKPPKFICIGLNYRDHAEETKKPIPDVPTVFVKFHTTIIGPGDSIVLPEASKQPDYEAEFAFIIGKGGRNIPASAWREHVFGYTMVNDVSARDFQAASTQWTMGKNFDTFAPMGPWIVTADEIADPHKLDISMTLSGEVLQNSNTRNLVFGVPKLVEFLSSVFTLEPGDTVSTGTPGGVGFVRTPPRYLKPGDEAVVRVEGLGELRNPVVAE